MDRLKVIANSSPLINLAKIEQLDLLHKLYKEITIPSAVHREIVSEGYGKPGSLAIQSLCDKKQIIIREIHNKDLYHALETELDLGEAEVITLALEIKNDLILLDETEARRVAASYKLPLTGFIGILIKASSAGLIEDFKKTLDKAIALGFYINPRLYQRLLS
jgi:predicted nucleic acid-binding protein